MVPTKAAEQALLAYLTPSQEKSWKERREILVRGSAGGLYQIRDLYEDGVVIARSWEDTGFFAFCFYVADPDDPDLASCLPAADQVLALKLMVEASEQFILDVKNEDGWDN